ncbi:MAG: diguanylate cyclase [Rickettsiales bacterium]
MNQYSQSIRIPEKGANLRLLIIDDDRVDRLNIRRCVSKAGFNASYVEADDLRSGFEEFNKGRYDCIFVDYMLPDGDGIDFINKVKERGCFTPIIMLTGQGSEEIAASAITSGACDYLTKHNIPQIDFLGVVKDSFKRANIEADLYKNAHYDKLTGLFNRFYFERHLSGTIQRSKRHSHNFAVMFLDLDKFKSVNDTYGHDFGDKVLKEASLRIDKCIRDSDIAARFGGDEFAIILEEIDNQGEESCKIVAERIINSIREPFVVKDIIINIGVSIGIAIYSGSGEYPEDLIKLADEAMYQAKKEEDGHYRFALNKKVA